MVTRARRPPAKKVPSDIFDLIGKGENIREASAAMQAMAHPLRLKILCLVNNQELSVLEIVDAVGTSQSNISQHLAVLRDTGHPVLAEILRLSAGVVPVRLCVGGLRAFATRAMDEKSKAYVRHHWQEVEAATGRPHRVCHSCGLLTPKKRRTRRNR